MIRSMVTTLVFLSVISLSAVHGEVYTWKDAQGTIHFTEDPGKVPKKLRKKVRVLEADDPAAETSRPVQSGTGAETTGAAVAAPEVGKGVTASGELFAGKTYDQWKKELADREASMNAVRARIDEIAAQVNSPALRMGEQQKLIAEHAALVKQFNELKEQYHQQVDIARKAGLQVNLQQ